MTALLPLPQAREAVAAMARWTGDATRDLPAGTLALVRRTLQADPAAVRLLPLFEGEARRDTQTLSRIFGEALPAGLVLTAS